MRSADATRVAGQDLVTLFAGSYGSLGLITEATFRLEPLVQGLGRHVCFPAPVPSTRRELVEMVADPSTAAVRDRRALAVGG